MAAPSAQTGTSVDVVRAERDPEGANNAAGSIEQPARPALADQSNMLPRRQVILVFIAAGCSAQILAGLDATMVGTAAPSISADLGGGSQAAWIASAYLLAGTVCQPLFARWSDIFGRKGIFQLLLLILFVGNLGSALSQSMTTLIVFRAITGVAGGPLTTLSSIIIYDVCSPRDKGKYQGLLAAASLTANTLGPLVAGVFSQDATWRACFYLLLPFIVIAAVIVQFAVPFRGVQGDWRAKLALIDYVGAGILLTGLSLVIYALNAGGVDFRWSSPTILATLVVGIVSLAGFVIWELRPRIPIASLRVFANRTVAAIICTSFVNGAAMSAELYWIPNFFQVVIGYSALKSGTTFVPVAAAVVTFSVLSAMLVAKTGRYKLQLLFGWASWSISLGLCSTFDQSTSVGKAIGYAVMTGLGMANTASLALVAVTSAVDREDQASTIGLRNLFRSLGGTFSTAIAGLLINNEVSSQAIADGLDAAVTQSILNDPTQLSNGPVALTPAMRESLLQAYTRGFRVTFIMLAAFAALSFFVSLLAVKEVKLRKATAEERQRAEAWLKSRKTRPSRRTPPPPEDIELASGPTQTERSSATPPKRSSIEHAVRPV